MAGTLGAGVKYMRKQQYETLKKITPLILAGGEGKRLQPISTPEKPKAFLRMNQGNSLLQETLERVSDYAPPIICSNIENKNILKEQLNECKVEPEIIILEPCRRNTAPAIIAAALAVEHDRLLIALPTDHLIKENEKFHENVINGLAAAREGYMVMMGIRPLSPEERYGYILPGKEFSSGISMVKSFREKPDINTAQKLIKQGALWNAGIFMFRSETLLREMEYHNPALISLIKNAVTCSKKDENLLLEKSSFFNAENISLDNALIEKSKALAVTVMETDWQDIGTIKAFKGIQ
jgi:mannose-1-phosphate guanylyltransferase/mannose-6-phosphate isomerase